MKWTNKFSNRKMSSRKTLYRTVTVDDLSIFYFIEKRVAHLTSKIVGGNLKSNCHGQYLLFLTVP